MPRKNKELMALTKVKKKTVENKRANMEKVRDLTDQFQFIYVFDVRNFRNPLMKKLKKEFEYSGRFFQGKVKPTMVALGINQQNEYRENLRLLSHSLDKTATGAHKGLFFCNNKPDVIIKYFNNYKIKTFPKTGFVATKQFIVKKGVLKQFIFSHEYILKKLGLPVILKNGQIILNQDYIICEKGQPLKPEQSKLLELFGEQMAEFYLRIHSYWTNNEFFECINNNNNNDDDDQKAMDQDQDNDNNDIQKNVNNVNQSFDLHSFVGDDDSSDDDIKDID